MKLALAILPTIALCTACGGGGDGASTGNTNTPAAVQRQALQATAPLSQAVAPAPSLATVSANQVMDWAEAHMADLFPGHVSTTPSNGFVFRYYPASGNFIAVSDDGTVGALLPKQSAKLVSVGTLAGLGCTVNPALTCTPFTPLVDGMSGDWPISNYVVRTEQEWAQAWASHRSQQLPEPQRPTIDFTRYMLLGISQGWGGACDNFGIKRLIDQKDALRVEYIDLPPPPYMACVAMAVPKISFVLVARSDKPVVFVLVNG